MTYCAYCGRQILSGGVQKDKVNYHPQCAVNVEPPAPVMAIGFHTQIRPRKIHKLDLLSKQLKDLIELTNEPGPQIIKNWRFR